MSLLYVSFQRIPYITPHPFQLNNILRANKLENWIAEFLVHLISFIFFLLLLAAVPDTNIHSDIHRRKIFSVFLFALDPILTISNRGLEKDIASLKDGLGKWGWRRLRKTSILEMKSPQKDWTCSFGNCGCCSFSLFEKLIYSCPLQDYPLLGGLSVFSNGLQYNLCYCHSSLALRPGYNAVRIFTHLDEEDIFWP